MASFKDILSKDQAERIHDYLIARGNEDWQEEAVPRDVVHGPAH
jgi:quinohemoprotein ethanol dehydrogenase